MAGSEARKITVTIAIRLQAARFASHRSNTTAPVAQEPHQARQPDREQNIADIEDLLLYKCKWTEHHVLARAADVVEILNRRKVMADLPDDVGQEKRDHDGEGN